RYVALTGVRRGTKGTHAQSHIVGTKIFDGGTEQHINNPNTFWNEPTITDIYNGTNGQWRFAGVEEVEIAPGTVADRSVVHFTDTANASFNSNVAVGDIVIITDTVVGKKYHI